MKNKKFSRIKSRIAILASACAVGGAVVAMPAYAMTSGEAAREIIRAVIKTVARIARLAGILILVYGAISFLFAMRSEDVDTKHRAFVMIAAGLGLTLVEMFLEGIKLENLIV